MDAGDGPVRRLLLSLDEHFNLQYLADRLQHEDRAVRDYLSRAASRIAENTPVVEPASIRISIVSPVYGIPLKYVRRYVRSILRQNHDNWELCFCIDGDPDTRVRHYLESLSATQPERFRLTVHAVNQGICAATRDALELTTGEAVVFADTDDILPRRTLDILAHAFAASPDTDLVYTNHDILTPWGYRIDPVYKPAWSPELLMACNYITHLVAVRRQCLDQVTGAWGDEVNGCQDWDFLFRAIPHARRIHHIPLVLYHWRAIGGSEATRGKPWTWQAVKRLQERHLAGLDPRLRWNFEDGSAKPVLEFAPGHAPPLRVFLLGRAETERDTAARVRQCGYPGDVDCVFCELTGDDVMDQARRLDDSIVEHARDDDPDTLLVLFLSGRVAEDATLEGLASQAAYASLPGVGCAWPFYGPWRGTYGPSQSFLQARRQQVGFFTSWSGNCLAGPLDGLLLRQATWRKAGGFQAGCEGVRLPQPLDALGALMGLRLLSLRFRNVAVENVVTSWMPPALDLGELNPTLDPYV